MVNLLGPGAFGAARSAAVRPAYTPANGAGDPDDWYKDCTSPTLRDGTEWRAAPLNAMLAFVRSLARKSGVAVSNLDDDLLTRAVRSQGYNWRVPGGTANDLTVTLDPPLLAYTAGLPLRVLTGAGPNTGAMTINVDALGAKSILRRGGGAMGAGDVPAASLLELVYDGTAFRSVGFVKSDVIGDTSIVGRTQIFTATGTFTVPAGVTQVEIEVWGAGGAGGASGDGTGNPAGAAGCGGGAGGYAYKRVFGLTPGGTVAATVGAGGIGVANAAVTGGTGGASSFGAHATANGGTGGASGRNATIQGGVGGTATGGDLNITGAKGGTGGPTSTFQAEYVLHIWNKGGLPARPIGTVDAFGTGATGIGYGSGGTGASGGAGVAGGNGAPGLVIVRW